MRLPGGTIRRRPVDLGKSRVHLGNQVLELLVEVLLQGDLLLFALRGAPFQRLEASVHLAESPRASPEVEFWRRVSCSTVTRSWAFSRRRSSTSVLKPASSRETSSISCFMFANCVGARGSFLGKERNAPTNEQKKPEESRHGQAQSLREGYPQHIHHDYQGTEIAGGSKKSFRYLVYFFERPGDPA